VKRLATALVVLLILGGVRYAHAQGVTVNDICNTYAKKSAGITISSATDTLLAELVANTAITVCNCLISQPGGAGTVYFESSTATACGGTLTRLSGTITANTSAGTSTNINVPNADTTFLQLPTGDGLCVKSTGTIVQGITCSYVQK
jgi:hypothetical protein